MSKESIISRAQEVFDTEIEGINALRNNIGDDFISFIHECQSVFEKGGKIVISGIGKSGYIGKKIAATLSSTGSPSVFMHPVEALHGDLGIIQKNDLLVAISYSGETDELLVMLNPAKRLGVKLASITCSRESRLGKISDIVVEMPVPREACPFNLAPTTTTTALLALGDAMAMVLLNEQGFTKYDYGRLHPGGAIGRMVTLTAKDIMRDIENTALVKAETNLRDTLLEMSSKRCGSAVIIDDAGKLLGIFTDGDFRRSAEKDLQVLGKTIGEVMTANPICINASSSVADVMKILENKKIDDIVVVNDDNLVVGSIDVQDLPGMKLM